MIQRTIFLANNKIFNGTADNNKSNWGVQFSFRRVCYGNFNRGMFCGCLFWAPNGAANIAKISTKVFMVFPRISLVAKQTT